MYNKERYYAWREDPVTKGFFNYLEFQKDVCLLALTQHDDMPHYNPTKLIGELTALLRILDSGRHDIELSPEDDNCCGDNSV